MQSETQQQEYRAIAILREVAKHRLELMFEDMLNLEVQWYLTKHNAKQTDGKQHVVRNGIQPPRVIHTNFGPLKIRRPRVRDRRSPEEQRLFQSVFFRKHNQSNANRKGTELYTIFLSGLVTGDMKPLIPHLFGRNFSESFETALCHKWNLDLKNWKNDPLEEWDEAKIIPIEIKVSLINEPGTFFILIGQNLYGENEIIAVHFETEGETDGWEVLFKTLKNRQACFEMTDEIRQRILKTSFA